MKILGICFLVFFGSVRAQGSTLIKRPEVNVGYPTFFNYQSDDDKVCQHFGFSKAVKGSKKYERSFELPGLHGGGLPFQRDSGDYGATLDKDGRIFQLPENHNSYFIGSIRCN